MTPPLWFFSCLTEELLAQAQFPALLVIPLPTAEASGQVAPLDLTVPKMAILLYVRMWDAVLVMTVLESKDYRHFAACQKLRACKTCAVYRCCGIRVHRINRGTWVSLSGSSSCGSLFMYHGSGQDQGNRCEHSGWRKLDLATCSPIIWAVPFWPVVNDANYLPFQTIVCSVQTKTQHSVSSFP